MRRAAIAQKVFFIRIRVALSLGNNSKIYLNSGGFSFSKMGNLRQKTMKYV